MKKKLSLAPIKTRLAKTADLKAFDLSKDEIRFLYKDGGADASTILEYAALADLLRWKPSRRIGSIWEVPLALLNPADYYESAEDIPKEVDEDEDEYLTLVPPRLNHIEEMAERFDIPGLHLLNEIAENYINDNNDFMYKDWDEKLYSAAFEKAADDCKCAFAAGTIPPPFKKERERKADEEARAKEGARLRAAAVEFAKAEAKAKAEREKKLAKAEAAKAKAQEKAKAKADAAKAKAAESWENLIKAHLSTLVLKWNISLDELTPETGKEKYIFSKSIWTNLSFRCERIGGKKSKADMREIVKELWHRLLTTKEGLKMVSDAIFEGLAESGAQDIGFGTYKDIEAIDWAETSEDCFISFDPIENKECHRPTLAEIEADAKAAKSKA